MKRFFGILPLVISALTIFSACGFDSKIHFNTLLLDRLSSIEAANAANVLQIRFQSSLSPEDAETLRRVNVNNTRTWATLNEVQVMTERGNWITVSGESRKINLADPALDDLAVDAGIPEGKYNRIKLVFADELTLSNDESAQPLADCSSCQAVANDIAELKRENDPKEKDPNASVVLIIDKPFEMKSNRKVLFAMKADLNRWVSIDDEDGEVNFNPTAEIESVDISGMQSPGKDIRVSFGNGQVNLVGEKDTLRDNAEFTAGMLSGGELSGYADRIKAPAGSTLLTAVELKPGMDFHRPLLVGIRYDASMLEDLQAEQIHVGYLDKKSGAIVELPVHRVDPANSMVYFYTSHFSTFLVFSGMFKLEHPSGINVRMNYSFINYYLNTIFPIAKPGFIPLPDPVGSISGSYTTNINTKLLKDKDFGKDKEWLTKTIAGLLDVFGYCGINIKLKYNVDYYLRSFDLRQLVFNVSSPADGIIQVSVNNGSKIDLGTLRTKVSVKPVHPVLSCECEDDCSSRFRTCKDKCRGNKLEKLFCKTDCTFRRDACKMRVFACSKMKVMDRQMDGLTGPLFRWLNRNNGFEESYSSRWRHVAIESFNLTMRFKVIAESGKPLSVRLVDEDPVNSSLALAIKDVDDSGTAGGPLGLIIHDFADKSDVLNDPINGLLNSYLKKKLPDEIQAQLTKVMAEVTLPENPKIRFDRSGFLANVALPIFLPVPDSDIMKKYFCRGLKDIPLPQITDTGELNIPSENHVGIGISTNIFEYVMTMFINKGFFCFVIPSFIPDKPVLSIMPSASPTIQYLGNSKVRFKFPYHISYGLGSVEQDGDIRFEYQFRPHIGGSGMHFAYLGFGHTFTDPGIVYGMAPFKKFLDEKRPIELAIPSFINPLNNLGLQTSMCRPQQIDLRNKNIMMDFRLEGMVLDYSGTKAHREWVWVNHESLQLLAPPDVDPIDMNIETEFLDRVYNLVFSQQRLVQYGLLTRHGDGEPYYLLDGKLKVEAEQVYQPLMQSMVGKRVALEGEWSSISVSHKKGDLSLRELLDLTIGKVLSRDRVIQERLFHARNIVNGHFYHEPGGVLRKENYAAQMVGNYENTIGVYAVNITGDSIPEILQVVRNDEGKIELLWHLRNSFDTVDMYRDGVVVTPLPEPFREINAVWNLEVLSNSRMEGDAFDRIKINGKKYKAVVDDNKTVNLLPFENPIVEVVNGSFEEDMAWANGTFITKSPQGLDGLYTLEGGKYIDDRSFPKVSAFNDYLNKRTYSNSLVLGVEDHDIGGTYTLEYYVKTSTDSSESASYDYEEKVCEWLPAPTPFGMIMVKMCKNKTKTKNYTLPIAHNLGVTVRLSRIGASCSPRFLTPAEQETHLTRITVRDINEGEPYTDQWVKRRVTFSVPWNEYCGMDINVDVKTDRIIFLDAFTLNREVTR